MLIGMRNAMLASGGWKNPYVTDGLVYMNENITPPQSGIQSIDVGTDILSQDFTVEWCGVHAATARDSIFVNPSYSSNALIGFGFGWWIDSNNININSRIYYSETNSGQQAGVKTQCSLTVDGGTMAAFYSKGTSYPINTGLTSSAIQQMHQSWRYINCAAGDYVVFDILRVYSRALTADEVAANYAVDKARFNLA